MTAQDKGLYPAASDVVFAEKFTSATQVGVNGGVINGDPVISGGVGTFDGNGDFIIYGSTTGDEATGTSQKRSVLFSVNSSESNIAVICEKGTNKHFVIQADTAAGEISFRVNTASTRCVTTSTPLDGAWHRIACTYDGNTTCKIYVDGVLEDTETAVAQAPTQDTDNFVLGAREDGSFEFDGELKNFVIIDRELNTQEVLDDYNNSTYNYMNKAVLNLPMHDKVGAAAPFTTTDLSGNGYDLTIVNSPTKLKHRNGYSFDGVVDSLLNASFPSPSAEYSVCCWFSMLAWGTTKGLVCQWNSTLSWLLYSPTSGVVKLNHRVSTTSYSAQKTGLVLNQVYFVVATFDGTNIKISVNGEDYTVGDAIATKCNSQTGDLFVARQSATETNCEIYDVKFFNFALTQTQVKDLYNQGSKYLGDN